MKRPRFCRAPLGDKHRCGEARPRQLQSAQAIDPFGTLVLPGILLLSHSPFLFGYAKPVPVNFRALRNPRLDMVWVALAGPATNIALALLAASAFHVLTFVPVNAAQWVADNLKKCVRDQCRSGGLQYASDPAAGRWAGRS